MTDHMTAIYHLALRDAWEDAVRQDQPYRRSTIERSPEEEGFIHCSFAAQVEATAQRFYQGRDDVLLLEIDPSLLSDPVRVEGSFPHIYGPLPLGAVVRVTAFPVDRS